MWGTGVTLNNNNVRLGRNLDNPIEASFIWKHFWNLYNLVEVREMWNWHCTDLSHPLQAHSPTARRSECWAPLPSSPGNWPTVCASVCSERPPPCSSQGSAAFAHLDHRLLSAVDAHLWAVLEIPGEKRAWVQHETMRQKRRRGWERN